MDPSSAPTAPSSGGADRRRVGLIAGAVVLAAVVIAGVAVAATRSDKKSAAAISAPTTVPGVTSSSTRTITAPGASSGGTTTVGGGSSSTAPAPPATGTAGATGAPTTTTEPPVAAVAAFSGLLDHDCSTPVAPGSPVPQNPDITLRWAASGGVVDISVDGPGIYQADVGSTGSRTLPFPCPGPHTYTLIAHGRNGTTATKSITVTSRSTTKCHPGGEACPP